MGRKLKLEVERVDDAEFRNAYGDAWQATYGDWTGSVRSGEARAWQEGEAYVVSLSEPDDDEPAGWPTTHADLDAIADGHDFDWPAGVKNVASKQAALTEAGFEPEVATEEA